MRPGASATGGVRTRLCAMVLGVLQTPSELQCCEYTVWFLNCFFVGIIYIS